MKQKKCQTAIIIICQKWIIDFGDFQQVDFCILLLSYLNYLYRYLYKSIYKDIFEDLDHFGLIVWNMLLVSRTSNRSDALALRIVAPPDHILGVGTIGL